jgi:mRNA interferase MazF
MALSAGPRRGALVTMAIGGGYGKPRPALVIQADAFGDLPSVTVLRLTSEQHDWPLLRITVAPSATNGLQKTSQVMIDKAATVPRAKLGPPFGQLDPDAMRSVDRALQLFLGLTITTTGQTYDVPAGTPAASD